MKIEWKNRIAHQFGEINVGESFFCDVLWIKVNQVENKSSGQRYNCIDLETGYFMFFEDDVEVERIKATITVER